MLNTDTILKAASQPRIPENTFFLEPQSYWQWKGELGFSDSPEFKAYTRAGKAALVLAVIFLLPLLLTQGAGAFIFFGGLSLLAGVAAIWLFRNAQRRNQYQAFGRVILGELVFIKKEYWSTPTADHPNSKHYRGGHYTTGQYSFKNPAGQTLVGDFRVWRNDIHSAKYPDIAEPGTPVVILYIDSDNYIVC